MKPYFKNSSMQRMLNNYYITWKCFYMNHSYHHGRPATKNTRKPRERICSHVFSKFESASLSFWTPEVAFANRLPVKRTGTKDARGIKRAEKHAG